MNNYSFLRVVGKGSYGEVNLVKHKTDRKQYVIKKLNLTTSSKRERRSAEQEAQLLSQLRHPNIVTYRESWEGEDCQLYIVMGFCEGGDLYHRLKQQKGELLPERQVVEWFVQIAMALQYLHEKCILHRDLKTQNIFLTKTNIIKVGDLGIARVLENQNDMASTLIGTPYYMSPELFSNKPYNHKSDVWALGCCVYEMSTLKHAFNAKDMNSLVYRIVEGKLPQMPSKYDHQLGELIKSMLCRRPDDRPDVKLILRQPYIKHQIAMFLAATKQKTAKSRKKVMSGSNRASSTACAVSSQPKCPQHIPQAEPNIKGAQQAESQFQEHRARSRDLEPCRPQTPLPQEPPPPDNLNISSAPLATLSNIDIDIHPLQPEERPTLGDLPQTSASKAHHDPPLLSPARGKRSGEKLNTPVPPPRKFLSGVRNGRGEGKKLSNGPTMQCVHGAPQAAPKLRTTEDQRIRTVDLEDKDDTMELLKDVAIESPAPELKEVTYVLNSLPKCKGPVKVHVESIVQTVAVNADSKDDTTHLLKAVPAPNHFSDDRESLESTEKLLESQPLVPDHVEPLSPVLEQDPAALFPHSSPLGPWVSRARRQKDRSRTSGDEDKTVAAQRPLPPPPVSVLEGRRRSREYAEKNSSTPSAPTSVSTAKEKLSPLPQERPMSARERRRLRQSQENLSQPAVHAVRRASYDVASSNSKQPESQNIPVTGCVSDLTRENIKADRLRRPSDEDECSSSTSSTDRSEGDCKEGKSESNDMQDLVQMMTQTLRMDVREAVCEPDGCSIGSRALPEFRLNRRYRDTLLLHGKAREEQEFPFSEVPTDTTGPAKIRRAIEKLRTDVVKGLGVKLLDVVLDIMEEEDEDKRKLRLLEEMGEEKYQSYAVMVRQLKFFEDVAFKG
ncbi:serine/threonine-protein kinase Nek4 isoform X1 [Osmerus mordax]|uniref:serine/threonine-protein kinase Nek4 isoform X1 n=1 Tax=Osmerus mordax TaxID=8014 RepID=UPI0035105DC4